MSKFTLEEFIMNTKVSAEEKLYVTEFFRKLTEIVERDPTFVLEEFNHVKEMTEKKKEDSIFLVGKSQIKNIIKAYFKIEGKPLPEFSEKIYDFLLLLYIHGNMAKRFSITELETLFENYNVEIKGNGDIVFKPEGE